MQMQTALNLKKSFKIDMRKFLIVLFILIACSVNVHAVEKAKLPTGGYVPFVERVDVLPEIEEDRQLQQSKAKVFMQSAESDGNFDSVNSYTEFYGYNTLKNEDEKLANAYLELAIGMQDKKEDGIKISDINLTEEQIEKVFYACLNDNPQFFYVNTGYSCVCLDEPYYGTYIFPDYFSGLGPDKKETFEDYANSIIYQSGVRPGMSDYDKAIMLHDELAMRVEYDDDAINEFYDILTIVGGNMYDEKIAQWYNEYGYLHSAYGALVKSSAVCDGYSRAYQYLLYKVGILSHVATGVANGGGHAWNLVKLDGKWYYTDLTWDDPDASGGFVFYEHFNITDEQLADCDHIIDNPYVMPQCNNTEHNYFVKNGGIMTPDGDIDNVTKQLENNSYARVYVTGDKEKVNGIWTWYKDNIEKIAEKLEVSGIVTYRYYRALREFHLILARNTLYPLKNIGSTSEREVKVATAFYDEDNRLIKFDISKRINLEKNAICVLDCGNALTACKKLKCFIWDEDNKLVPLYYSVSVTY